MAGILQIPVSTAGATLVWAARSDTTVNTLLLINQDLNNTVYIGQDQSITAGGQNVIPLAPNGSLSVDPNSAWYVIGATAGIAPLVMVPNGQATFRNLTQGQGKLAVPSIQSPDFQLSPLTGWSIDQNGNAYFENVSVGNPVSGALNPNPYFNGGDISGWVANNGNGVVSAVSGTDLPANAPYKYALKYVGSSGAIESEGRFPVTAGNQYQFSPWVNTSDNSAQNAFYGFAWYNAAGMWISDSVVSSAVPVNTWSQVSTVQTAPANAVSAAPKARPNNGTMFIQAAIVSPQVPGTLIQPHSITTDQLIANLVVAGIVDGTLIQGAQIVSDDAKGNSVTVANGIISFAVPGAPNGMISVNALTHSMNFSTAPMYLFDQPIVIVQPGGNIPETWHPITLDAGWTAGAQPPQYRMLPDGNVQVRGNATIAGTTAAVNINSANPLIAAYRPQQTRYYRPPMAQDAAGSVQMGTNGVLAMRISGFTATQAILDGIYSI